MVSVYEVDDDIAGIISNLYNIWFLIETFGSVSLMLLVNNEFFNNQQCCFLYSQITHFYEIISSCLVSFHITNHQSQITFQ